LELNKENSTGSFSLIDDRTTVATLRNFLATTPPPGIGPVDLLHVVQLMLRKAEDHSVFDSQQTLAQHFGVDAKTIVRSQKRLEKIGWLSRPRRKGRTNALSLNFTNIPAEEPLRLKLTPFAGHLAVRYQAGLRRMGRQRFPKHWLTQQLPSAQRILDHCGGDVDHAAQIISHALNTPPHRAKSQKGMYTILGRWAKIMKTFALRETVREQRKMEEPHDGE
jgi:hypothetical protein